MFKDKDFITEIDLSKYDTSSFKSFDAMFLNCKSLTSINFGNCKTSFVTIMNSMFNGCTSLESLDLSCFDTSQVTSMGNLFNDCKLLSSLDVSSFNTSKVLFFDNMFNNCGSLTSLNLSNFEMSNGENLENLFKDCANLQYINLQRAHIKEGNVNINDTFKGINKNFAIYIDENSKLLDSIKVDNKKNCSIIISNKWDNTNKNLLFINNQTKLCTYNCYELQLYKYEYEGHCYEHYPKQIMITTYIEKNIIENIITEKIIKQKSTEIFYTNVKTENNNENIDIISTNNNIDNTINKTTNCEIADFILNKCDKNFFNEEDKYLFKKEIITSIQNGSLSEILTEVIQNGTNLIIQNEKELYQISTLSNQIKINNISFLNFTQCEEILKEKNIIKENEDLLMFKIEHKKDTYNIPIIEYALFNENFSLINLEECNNINSKYFIPVSIKENDYDKYNPESEYYNDECKKSSEDGRDLTIYDRKNNYNSKNMSLCEANCTLEGFDSNESKVECNCKIKSYILTSDNLNQDDLLNKIDNSQSNTNFNLMKCANSFSLEEDIQSNSGFYLLLIIIILFIIIMILFICRGYNSLENKIDQVIYSKFGDKKKKKSKTLRMKKSKNISNINDYNIFNINKRKKMKKKKEIIKPESKNNILNHINNKKNNLVVNQSQNLSKLKNEENIKYENDYELNNLSYELALKFDKREFCDYYFALIKNKQVIFFSFFLNDDYNSGIIKKFIFFLSFALHYTINALFFTDKIMHQIYEDGGKYNIIFQFPYITYSAIISTVILRIILSTLVLTEKSILEVKKQQTENMAKIEKKKALKCVIIKFIIFSCLNLVLLTAFWYYLTCFNAVYSNTQIDLIFNTLISFGISLIYPFFINIIPSILRLDALDGQRKNMKKNNKINKKGKKGKNKTKNNNNNEVNVNDSNFKNGEYCYKLSQWLQLL